jgi:hypothetical protein
MWLVNLARVRCTDRREDAGNVRPRLTTEKRKEQIKDDRSKALGERAKAKAFAADERR